MESFADQKKDLQQEILGKQQEELPVESREGAGGDQAIIDDKLRTASGAEAVVSREIARILASCCSDCWCFTRAGRNLPRGCYPVDV